MDTFELMRARVFGVLLGRLEIGHVVIDGMMWCCR